MYPYNDDRLQQIMGAAASLPPSTYSQQYAADPQRAQAMMQRFTGNMLLPQDGILLPEEPATGVESAPQYATGDTSFDALDVAKTILGTPFALLRAGREGLEDVLGHPNAQRRQAADAYIAQMQPYMEQQQKMQLLQSSLRPEQAAALGMLPVPSPLASQPVTGMPTGGQPNAEPAGSRKTGVAQWLKNLTRDDRAQKVAQIQAYLRQQAFDLKRREAEAGIGTDIARQGLLGSQKYGQEIENRQLDTYGDTDWQLKLGERRANIGQSGAAAYNSMMHGNQAAAMTPGMVAEQAAQTGEAQAKERNAWTWGDALSESEVERRKQAAAASRSLAEQRTEKASGQSDFPKLAAQDTERRQLFASSLSTLKKGGMDDDEAMKLAGQIAGVEITPGVDPWGPFGDRPAEPDFESFDPFKLKGRTPTRVDEGDGGTPGVPIPGETNPSVTGRTAEILRTYPTAQAIVAAQKAGKITLEEGAAALDSLGVARRPKR